VAVARALVNEPTLLLGDEPTGNLDSKTGTEIMQLLQALNQQGLTIVLVTHDPRLSDYATRTVEMLDGLVMNKNGSGADRPVVATDPAADVVTEGEDTH
jgi:ABC-type lipoprotein export system ATPase subunit